MANPAALVRQCLPRAAYPREDGVEADRELILEDVRSIREGFWRMARLVQDAAGSLDARIEDELFYSSEHKV